MAERDFLAMARDYAKDVKAGRIVACRLTRLACLRHLTGLTEQRRRTYPYRLDEAAAVRVCTFVELLPHVKGKWALNRERIRLEPWQAFILVNVFGWLRKRDNTRRYRRVYIEVPRKNAKSTLTAAICNYMLCADNEAGAEVYSGATSEKQAWEVFGPARLMAEKTPALQEHYGVAVGAKNVAVLATNSKCEPIIGNPGDGASPSFSVTDEYHEHTTSNQYDTMVTGMAGREQPIAWVITTAGSDTAGPCYLLRSEAVDVLEGKVEQDDLFAIIYTIDEKDDWTSDLALRKANPNLGVSVKEDKLVSDRHSAINNPHKQSTFKTKHLNVWVTAASPYFNHELWKRLGDESLREEQFAGEEYVGGVDLAATIDMAVNMRLFRREIGGANHYYAFGRYYVPEAQAAKPENRHYAGWIASGHMTATPGDIIDLDAIEDDLKDDAARFSLVALGFDRYDATQIITHMQNHVGADRVVEVPQTVEWLSPAMKELQGLIEAGRIHHNGDPVLAWCIGNVTAQVDRKDNVFPRKERADRKIDAAVALLNALSLVTKAQIFESGGSVYDTRGLLTV